MLINESGRLVVHILMNGGSSIISGLHSDVTLFVINCLCYINGGFANNDF